MLLNNYFGIGFSSLLHYNHLSLHGSFSLACKFENLNESVNYCIRHFTWGRCEIFYWCQVDIFHRDREYSKLSDFCILNVKNECPFTIQKDDQSIFNMATILVVWLNVRLLLWIVYFQGQFSLGLLKNLFILFLV